MLVYIATLAPALHSGAAFDPLWPTMPKSTMACKPIEDKPLENQPMEAVAEEAAESAAPARGRGRPKGCSFTSRVRTVKFGLDTGVATMHPLAINADLPGWTWGGRSYPKTKRSHGPNMHSLNHHSTFLKLLFELAPNGYPDPYRLRDLFVQLHDIYTIFDPRSEADRLLSLPRIAILAADRWRIMCKHCIIIDKGGNKSRATLRA